MRTLAAMLALSACAVGAQAQSFHYVRPHVTSNGTYVEGHMQTNPNGTRMDNWSTQRNVNPYTGQAGTVDPYRTPQTYKQPAYTPPSYGQKCGYTSSGRYVCR